MTNACADCCFWFYGSKEISVGVEFCQCRRNPPMAFRSSRGGIDDGVFPYTPSGAWCGEFQNHENHHG